MTDNYVKTQLTSFVNLEKQNKTVMGSIWGWLRPIKVGLLLSLPPSLFTPSLPFPSFFLSFLNQNTQSDGGVGEGHFPMDGNANC